MGADPGVRRLVIGAAVVATGVGLLVLLGGPASLPLTVGSPAPPLVLRDLEGRERSLEELRGKVVFLNFWGPWCAPCRSEAPSLVDLYGEFHAEGFEIFAVSVTDPSADTDAGSNDVTAFRLEFGVEFPILIDSERRAYRDYRVTGVPETFLIDPQGRIVEHFIGPRDWSAPRYARALRRLLPASEAESAARTDGRG